MHVLRKISLLYLNCIAHGDGLLRASLTDAIKRLTGAVHLSVQEAQVAQIQAKQLHGAIRLLVQKYAQTVASGQGEVDISFETKVIIEVRLLRWIPF